MTPTLKAIPGTFRHRARLYLALGIANWAIFVGHIPDNIVNLLNLRNFGFSGPADLYVFSVGYGIAILHRRMARERGFIVAATRIFHRVWRLYAAYVILFVIYIETIAYVASQSTAPELLHEYNIAGILDHPLRLLVRGLMLQEEPTNLDLLQLMIPLMAFYPLVFWGLLRRPNFTLAASIALYFGAIYFDWNFPIFPDRSWSYNPFCWQLLIVLGAWFALTGAARRALRGMWWLRLLAGAYLLFALIITFAQHWPALVAYVPDFILDPFTPNGKGALPPCRILHWLALAFIATYLLPANHPALGWKSLQPIIKCGEQWLAVFCIGVFLSLAGHLILITGPQYVLMDIAVTLAGFAAMTAVAYYVSWSKQQDSPAARQARPPHAIADR